MAVQARHFAHDLPPAVGGSLFLDEYAAGCVPAPARVADATTVLAVGDFPRSDDLAWCNYGFPPRKRPRMVADQAPLPASGGFLDDHLVGIPPAGTECLLPVPPLVGDVRSRAVRSGAASTSGRVASGATLSRVRGPLLSSWTHHHSVEIDALVRLEAERMRAALEEARRRHARALAAAVGRAASGRLRESETGLARALRRNAELEEEARQAAAECQAWMGVARSHEAVAAGLRAALDKLLRLPCGGAAWGGCEGGGDAEDAQSCCFEAPAATVHADPSSGSKPAPCKSCGGGEACVLLLPCRHLCLCLCRACDAAVDACPVCAAAKNASLHVLFS